MKIASVLAAAVLSWCASTASAQAQAPAEQRQPPVDRPTVAKYLAEGYEVLQAEIGNPFLQFILHKKTASGQVLVWCSVLLQTGETSSCRTIK
jgi:hypothetical protein